MLPTIWIAAVAAAVAFTAGWAANGWRKGAELSVLKAEHSTAVAEAGQRAVRAMEAALARESALLAQTERIVDEARDVVRQAEVDVAAGVAAGSSMLNAARTVASRCAASPPATPASGSAGASVPSGMSDGDRLLFVLGTLQADAGAYAADSGRARAARDVCERVYNAARAQVNPSTN